MTIAIAGAEAYFAADNHLRATDWTKFSTPHKTAAIAQSRRILSRAMDRELDDNEAAYVETDATRDDFAVYEQALHILMNTTLPNAQGAAPQYANLDLDVATQFDASVLAPEALHWLGWNGLVCMRRG